jgi:hypothetical protein
MRTEWYLGRSVGFEGDEKGIYCDFITKHDESSPKEKKKRHRQMMLSLGTTG